MKKHCQITTERGADKTDTSITSCLHGTMEVHPQCGLWKSSTERIQAPVENPTHSGADTLTKNDTSQKTIVMPTDSHRANGSMTTVTRIQRAGTRMSTHTRNHRNKHKGIRAGTHNKSHRNTRTTNHTSVRTGTNSRTHTSSHTGTHMDTHTNTRKDTRTDTHRSTRKHTCRGTRTSPRTKTKSGKKTKTTRTPTMRPTTESQRSTTSESQTSTEPATQTTTSVPQTTQVQMSTPTAPLTQSTTQVMQTSTTSTNIPTTTVPEIQSTAQGIQTTTTTVLETSTGAEIQTSTIQGIQTSTAIEMQTSTEPVLDTGLSPRACPLSDTTTSSQIMITNNHNWTKHTYDDATQTKIAHSKFITTNRTNKMNMQNQELMNGSSWGITALVIGPVVIISILLVISSINYKLIKANINKNIHLLKTEP